jgi:hypothetical protein
VCKRFVSARSRKIPISGKVLQARAKEVAEKFGKNDFTTSNGWLQSLKNKHSIVFRDVCGEADVNEEIVTE